MEKAAQKRSLYNKIREKTNVSGIAAEKFFNPEFKKVMESLRATDDSIRSIVLGEVVGIGTEPTDAIKMKQLLKSAKSNLNRREYMSAVADLGRFHKQTLDLIKLIKKLDTDVNQVHNEFLFKDLKDEHKKELSGLKSRFSNYNHEYLIKQADMMDFFHNITSQRGRALAAWEARYPKVVKQFKNSILIVLNKSLNFYENLVDELKNMAAARSVRNVDKYMQSAERVIKYHNGYESSFKEEYNKNIKPFLDKVNLDPMPVETPNAATTTQVLNQEISETPANQEFKASPVAAPTLTMPSMPAAKPSAVPTETPIPEKVESKPISGEQLVENQTEKTIPAAPAPVNKPTVSVGDVIKPEVPNTPPPPVAPPMAELIKARRPIKKSHHDFTTTLEKMSNYNPIIISSFIKKYAKSIEQTDYATSIKLLNLAQQIIKDAS